MHFSKQGGVGGGQWKGRGTEHEKDVHALHGEWQGAAVSGTGQEQAAKSSIPERTAEKVSENQLTPPGPLSTRGQLKWRSAEIQPAWNARPWVFPRFSCGAQPEAGLGRLEVKEWASSDPWLPLRQSWSGHAPTIGIQLLGKDKTTSRVWLGLTWPRMGQGLTLPPFSTLLWLQMLAIVSYLVDTAGPVAWHVESKFCMWQQRRPDTLFL